MRGDTGHVDSPCNSPNTFRNADRCSARRSSSSSDRRSPQAEAHAWRPLFWIVAGIAALALILAALTFDDAPPADRDAPRDLPAIALATVGCTAAFVGAAQLTSHDLTDLAVSVPMFGGLALIVALIVYQFRSPRPLLTIRTMLTSAIPVAGVGVALFAAAASVAATALTAAVFLRSYSPVHVGLLYLPELGGAVVMAVVVGFVISRRATHYLPLAGMGLLTAGILVGPTAARHPCCSPMTGPNAPSTP